jgi:Domain of unknown function (DUF4189)
MSLRINLEENMFLTRAAFICGLITLTVLPAHADNAKWGAIAVDKAVAEREPYYGVGGGDTEQDASDAAMGFCKDAGGADCQPVITYELCGALAVSGDGKGGWGQSASKDGAEKQAISACADAKCKVVVSDCNGDY